MIERRAFLKATFGTLAGLALGLPVARLFASEPALAAAELGQGLHFVDGWILTSADLEALASHEV